jgi:Transposase, Mutator family
MVRGFIEELIGQELDAALGRGRYERDAEAPKGYRNGTRERQLLGSFGPVELSVGSVKNLGRYAASWIAGWPNRPSSTAALT